MLHKHHIVPKHKGGTDDPSNLVEVTPIQHAMFHYCEWKLWGDYKDFCAYKMILGDVNNPEFRRATFRAFRDIILEGGRKWRERNPHKLRENGVKGNRSQRKRFEEEGRTVAEKDWIVTSPEGDVFEVRNLAQFCRENDLLNCKLSEVASGKRNHHKGWKVRRA